MNAAEILGTASKKGVAIFLDSGRIAFQGEEKAVASILPELREHKEEIIRMLQAEAAKQQLVPFQLDAIPDTPETERINNMAWEFMQAEGMPYAEAIRQAAELAAKCYAAPCEAAYENVRELWKRITGAITDSPHVSDIVSQLNRPFSPKLE